MAKTTAKDARGRRPQFSHAVGGVLHHREEHRLPYTQSPSHSYHLSISNLKKHELTKPCPMLTFTKLDMMIADAEIPAALAKGYREAPTALKTTNRNLHDRILFYISNAKGREDYEREANGNYITLIELIVAEDDDADAEIATWANNEKNKLVKGGLSSNTIVSFDHFRLQFENFNDMCKQGAGGRRDDDSVISTIYTNIVRDLGDLVETRLEMKLEAAGAVGDLNKTVKIIRRLLGRMEGKAMGSARTATWQTRAMRISTQLPSPPLVPQPAAPLTPSSAAAAAVLSGRSALLPSGPQVHTRSATSA